MTLSGAWKEKLRISKTFNCLFDLTVYTIYNNFEKTINKFGQDSSTI